MKNNIYGSFHSSFWFFLPSHSYQTNYQSFQPPHISSSQLSRLTFTQPNLLLQSSVLKIRISYQPPIAILSAMTSSLSASPQDFLSNDAMLTQYKEIENILSTFLQSHQQDRNSLNAKKELFVSIHQIFEKNGIRHTNNQVSGFHVKILWTYSVLKILLKILTDRFLGFGGACKVWVVNITGVNNAN